jgi:phage terminase small subunit
MCNGLTRRQRTFLLEKLTGLNDKEAALAAGYSPSMAENTKQKIWAKPQVHEEFRKLEHLLSLRMKSEIVTADSHGSTA